MKKLSCIAFLELLCLLFIFSANADTTKLPGGGEIIWLPVQPSATQSPARPTDIDPPYMPGTTNQYYFSSPSLTIYSQSTEALTTSKDPAYLWVNPSGGSYPYTYQWQVRRKDSYQWNNLYYGDGYRSDFLKVDNYEYGDQFRCVVTDSKGATATSDPVTIQISSIARKLSIITQPTDITAKTGDSVSFSVTASGDIISYEWQQSSSGITWSTMSSAAAKSSTLKLKASTSTLGKYYRCQIKDIYGAVVVTKAVIFKQKCQIDRSSGSVTTTVGSKVQFFVKASGDSLTYQWQEKTSDAKSWNDITWAVSNKDTLSFNVSSANRFGSQYRCKIMDKYGVTLYSKPVTLQKKSTPAKITSQPHDATVSLYQTAQLTVKTTGDVVSYQWQERASASANWTNSKLTGSKTKGLAVTLTSANVNHQYRCVIKDADGNTLYTSIAILKQKEQSKSSVSSSKGTSSATSVSAASALSFRAVIESSGRVQLIWNPVSGASGYSVSSADSLDAMSKQNSSKGNRLSSTITYTSAGMLKSSSTQYYQLSVYQNSGNSSSLRAVTSATMLSVSSKENASMDVVAQGKEWVSFLMKTSLNATSFQWQERKSPADRWLNLSSSNDSMYTFQVQQEQLGHQFRCVIHLSNGKDATSEVVTLWQRP